MIKLFDHTVLPILTYGSEIFGYENTDILEKVHNDFLRKITCARKSTPISFLQGELGRYPIAVNIKHRMVSFWSRLITGKEQKNSFIIYNYLLNNASESSKWMQKIKNILISAGRPDLWENQLQLDPQYLKTQIRILKQTLIDQYKQDWHASLQSSNKGLIYYSFKQDHKLEPYLTKLDKCQYTKLFKMRTTNHLLPVESGRYDGTPFEDRSCTLCDTGEVGTEKHYILKCRYFRHERDRLLGPINPSVPENILLKYFLGEAPEDLLKKTCTFISLIMSKFKT